MDLELGVPGGNWIPRFADVMVEYVSSVISIPPC